MEVFDLSGQHILEMLEYAVTNEPYAGARMVQVSGDDIYFNTLRYILSFAKFSLQISLKNTENN